MTCRSLAALAPLALALALPMVASAQGTRTMLEILEDPDAPVDDLMTPPTWVLPGASPADFCRALGNVGSWMIDTSTETSCLDGVVDTSVDALDTDALVTAIAWAREQGIDVRLEAAIETPTLVGPGDKPEAHCVGARPPAPFR